MTRTIIYGAGFGVFLGGRAVRVGGANDKNKNKSRNGGSKNDNDEDEVVVEVIMNWLQKIVQTILNIVLFLAAELARALKIIILKHSLLSIIKSVFLTFETLGLIADIS